MKPHEIAELIEKIELSGTNRKKMLKCIKIPVSTYYHWREVYWENGINGLIKMSTSPGRVWNKILPDEEDVILEEAKLHPELTPRLIAVKITDNKGFYVGEKTVYRLLKKYNLVSRFWLEKQSALIRFSSNSFLASISSICLCDTNPLGRISRTKFSNISTNFS